MPLNIVYLAIGLLPVAADFALIISSGDERIITALTQRGVIFCQAPKTKQQKGLPCIRQITNQLEYISLNFALAITLVNIGLLSQGENRIIFTLMGFGLVIYFLTKLILKDKPLKRDLLTDHGPKVVASIYLVASFLLQISY